MTHPSRKKLLRFLFVLIACALAPGLLLLQGSSSDLAVSGSSEEGIIEQFRYVFAWNGFTAAVAEYTLTRRIVEGRPTLHFTGRARTTEGIDLFWRMRDSALALIDGATLAPRRFQLFRRENKKRVYLDVVHDLEEKKFRISRLKGDRLKKGTLPSRGVYGPVSAMLVLRQKPLKPGDVETIRVMEGKRIYEITLKSLARERILIGEERVPAIKLAMTYRSEDGRRSSGADGIRYTHIWVGEEAAHPILRLKTRVPLGVISGERVSANDPDFPSMDPF